MAEFKLGFNVQTVFIVICITSSLCLLFFGGYLISKICCNKKSEETKKLAEITKPAVTTKPAEITKPAGTTKPAEITKWTPVDYNRLKDKVNLELNSVDGKIVEKYSKDTLVKCVTNRFTVEYNDPKFIDDSDFKSKVQKLKAICENGLENADPGPPIWTNEVINDFKNNIADSFKEASTPPNSYQLDCIVRKIRDQNQFPRDLGKLNEKEKNEMLLKIMQECNYNPSSNVGESTFWSNPEHILKLKALILKYDSSILNTTGLLSCVTKEIISEINDPMKIDIDKFIIENTETKKQNCLQNNMPFDKFKSTFPWIDRDFDEKIKPFFSDWSRNMKINLTEQQLKCIADTSKDIFETPEQLEKIQDKALQMSFIYLIIGKCFNTGAPMGPTTESPAVTMGPTTGSPAFTMGPTTGSPAVTMGPTTGSPPFPTVVPTTGSPIFPTVVPTTRLPIFPTVVPTTGSPTFTMGPTTRSPAVTMGPTTGSPTFPPGQCRGDAIWKNTQGHTCDIINNNKGSDAGWTDETKKLRAGDYCSSVPNMKESDYCFKFRPTPTR
jgi:hypothetical protein